MILKCEIWMTHNYRITIAKTANMLGPGTWVPAVKSNKFAAGTVQAKILGPRNGILVHSSSL